MKATKPLAPTKHFFEYFNENLPKNWDEPALTDYDDVTVIPTARWAPR